MAAWSEHLPVAFGQKHNLLCSYSQRDDDITLIWIRLVINWCRSLAGRDGWVLVCLDRVGVCVVVCASVGSTLLAAATWSLLS